MVFSVCLSRKLIPYFMILALMGSFNSCAKRVAVRHHRGCCGCCALWHQETSTIQGCQFTPNLLILCYCIVLVALAAPVANQNFTPNKMGCYSYYYQVQSVMCTRHHMPSDLFSLITLLFTVTLSVLVLVVSTAASVPTSLYRRTSQQN